MISFPHHPPLSSSFVSLFFLLVLFLPPLPIFCPFLGQTVLLLYSSTCPLVLTSPTTVANTNRSSFFFPIRLPSTRHLNLSQLHPPDHNDQTWEQLCRANMPNSRSPTHMPGRTTPTPVRPPSGAWHLAYFYIGAPTATQHRSLPSLSKTILWE